MRLGRFSYIYRAKSAIALWSFENGVKQIMKDEKAVNVFV